MYIRTPNFNEFCDRVRMLYEPQFVERNLPSLPDWFFGDFRESRLPDILRIVQEYPEYHIVSCVKPEVYVNGFIRFADAYYLAEGENNSKLIYDPGHWLDVHSLQSLNSGKRSSCA